MTTPVLVPLLNPNEPEALLAALHVQEGQRVAPGDLLCSLETTKSTAEVEAEAAGYVAGLRYAVGASLKAGEVLCYLAETPDWVPPAAAVAQTGEPAGDGGEPPPGVRITRPALELARQLGLDLKALPEGEWITESTVRQLAAKPAAGAAYAVPAAAFDPRALIIYGGGGHGKSLIDLVRLLGTYQIAGILDDGIAAGGEIMGVPLLGGGEQLAELHARGVRLAINAVGGIGSLAPRLKVFQRLAEAGFACPAVVHPAGFVEVSAALAPGVQVFAQAYVGSEARLGYGCIVNSGAIVSHDCQLGNYSNISPGALLAGEVQVGPGALVGMGATINLRVRIGAGARIGNGATVKADVPEKGIVRAGTIWPGD